MMMSTFKIKMKDVALALVHLAIILSLTALCSGDPDGFISIDCGSTQREYVDSRTNLTWKGDEPYTVTGNNGAIPQSLGNTLNSTLENYQALKSFRYFPKLRQKYCYELPLRRSNATFLIRAMFLHGHSPLLHPPISFQIYVNATLWIKVQYGMHDEYDFSFIKPEVREAMYFNKDGEKVNLCLVPGKGMPFISSLELREMDSIAYTEALTGSGWSRSFLLSALGRWNVASDGTPTVRYPDDVYDRLWTSFNHFGYGSVVNTSNVSTHALKELNNLPSKVAEGALDWYGLDEIALLYPFSPPRSSLACFIFYLHSNEGILKSNFSIMQAINDVSIQAFEITEQTTMKYLLYKVWQNSTDLLFSSSAERGPELLAVEAYLQDESNSIKSYDDGDRIVNFIKTTFNMPDWQGDYCIPKPHDWLTCMMTDDGTTFFIYSITLTHRLNIEELVNLPPSVMPIFSWSITYSNLNDDTLFNFLVTLVPYTDTSRVLDINFLNVSHNNITSELFNKTRWKTKLIGYEIWPAPFGQAISIDLSHNHLNNIFFYIDLQAFFLDNRYKDQLQALDISYNDMAGEIPSNFLSFFFNSKSLQALCVDHNAISGKVNLTTWYNKVQAAVQDSRGSKDVFRQLFSLLNNNILDIILSVKEMESRLNVTLLIDQFSKYGGGLLLGNNSFCTSAKTLLHKYLCRSALNDTSYAIHKKKPSKVPLFVGIPGGGVTLLGTCILLFIIWRLYRQVNILRQFQQELLDRRVQPPFFSYHDLKIATKDFHQSNELGSGAFGAVYKGILQDKREVAVKKLFNSEGQVQVLNDFLNEVVLLTGIRHKNLVQLLGCCVNEKERILVYEFAEKGNVADALWGQGVELQAMLSWEERVNICKGVARGLSYLHKELQPGIIHRDIKAANILIDKTLNPKIADFGLAKLFREEETQAQFTFIAGTRGYLAPEYIMEGILTDKADVYSFGVLALEIVSGRKCIDPTQPPEKVSLKSWAETLQEQGKLLELLPLGLEEKCPSEEFLKVINIALLCVGREPRLRPTMPQVAVMLAGTADDTLFLSLSEVRHSSDKMAFHFGRENDHPHEWMSLIPWAGGSSRASHEQTDRTEEDALIGSTKIQPLSIMDKQSCQESAATTFREREGTVSQSLGRKIRLALGILDS